MTGRGDKNKNRGLRKQTNHPYAENGHMSKKKKVSSSKFKSGNLFDPSANSGRSHDGNKPEPPGGSQRHFNLVVDSVPYLVNATSYRFNDETRYRVSINGNAEHIFTWDSDLKRLIAIDDESSILPDNLEEAISVKLQSGK